MYKTKVLHLLQHFDSLELNHLKKFLVSPFFNKREDVVRLFDFMVGEMTNSKPDFSKEKAFTYIFPNKKWKGQEMYNELSDLFKLVEQFLAVREFSNNTPLVNLQLAKAYRAKKQKKGFQKVLKQGKKILEKQSLRDRKYMLYDYELEFEYYDYVASKANAPENNLQALADKYDQMYIAEKLKLYCFQIAHRQIFNNNYSIRLQEAILQLLEQDEEELSKNPMVNLYYLSYQAATTDNEKYFLQLRKKMLEYQNNFAESEMRDINLLAINFCIKKMNTGKEEYIKEALELYRFGLERKYLIENNEISTSTYRNVVLIGIKLKEYIWVEEFIKNYKPNLNYKIRNSISNYCLATLRYEQKKYKEAMRLLIDFSSKDYTLFLSAKFTLAKMYYELNEINPLDSLLQSMNAYLNNKKKIGEKVKSFYKKIIKLLKKLLKLIPSKTAKNKFRAEVTELSVPSAREWFLRQLL